MTKKNKAMTQKSKRIGDVITVENQERRFGSATQYVYVRVQLETGEEVPLLFTNHEMDEARARAEANTEDLPKVGWVRDIFD